MKPEVQALMACPSAFHPQGPCEVSEPLLCIPALLSQDLSNSPLLLSLVPRTQAASSSLFPLSLISRHCLYSTHTTTVRLFQCSKAKRSFEKSPATVLFLGTSLPPSPTSPRPDCLDTRAAFFGASSPLAAREEWASR